MPTISMFYGIVICLYFYDERHKLPHIHAKYQGQEASFSITDGEILSGAIPMAKTRLVQAWIEITTKNGGYQSAERKPLADGAFNDRAGTGD